MSSSGKQSWFSRHCKPAPAWKFTPVCFCDACFRKQQGAPKEAPVSDWPYAHPRVNNNGFYEPKATRAPQAADWPYIHPSDNNNGLSQPSSAAASIKEAALADDASSTYSGLL